MTNEEKIRQIRVENLRVFDGYGVWMDCVDIDNALLEMAEWKDEQYKEEKKELLSLVNLLENNQTIIEGLKAILNNKLWTKLT